MFMIDLAVYWKFDFYRHHELTAVGRVGWRLVLSINILTCSQKWTRRYLWPTTNPHPNANPKPNPNPFYKDFLILIDCFACHTLKFFALYSRLRPAMCSWRAGSTVGELHAKQNSTLCNCTNSTDYYQTWYHWYGLGPLNICQVSWNFVGRGLPRKLVKYNLSVNF